MATAGGKNLTGGTVDIGCGPRLSTKTSRQSKKKFEENDQMEALFCNPAAAAEPIKENPNQPRLSQL
jgi:hypothetical protein